MRRSFARFTNQTLLVNEWERVLNRLVSLISPPTPRDHALEPLGRFQVLGSLGLAVWIGSRVKARTLDYVAFVVFGRGSRVSCLLGYRLVCGMAGHQDMVVDVAAAVGNALNVAHFAFLFGVWSLIRRGLSPLLAE